MEVIYILDIIGTVVFAISGAMSAATKRLDLFGALFTGFITAVGGGSLRDMLLGATPVVWLVDLNYVIAIVVGVGLTFMFQPAIAKLRKTLFLFDTIGIATFTIIGLNKALVYDIHPLLAVILGVMTAVMGGVMRDTFVNDIPLIFRKEIYATACVFGALVYLGLDYLGVSQYVSLLLTVVLIIAIRLLSIRFHLRLPVIHDKD